MRPTIKPSTIKRAITGGLLCLALLPTGPLLAADDSFPPPHRADYTLHHGSFKVGNVTLELTQGDDGLYRYSSNSKSSGFLSWFYKASAMEQSWFRLQDGIIQPTRYQLDRRDGKRKRKARLEFDWDRNRVTNQVAGTTWKLAIPAQTIDKLAVNLAVMHDLAKATQTLSYQVADGGKLKHYQFEIKGEEKLETPIGTLQTIKVTRNHKKDRTTTLWCATQLNYLPVRIERQEKGELVRMQITALSGIEIKP